jgi:ABC-type polysaccharide/polyol phosphate export permease
VHRRGVGKARDTTKLGEARLVYLRAVLEPLLYLIAQVLLFTYRLRRYSLLEGRLALFMVTGMMTYSLYLKLANYLAGAVDENRAVLSLLSVKMLD